jgi:hypothetical protein
MKILSPKQFGLVSSNLKPNMGHPFSQSIAQALARSKLFTFIPIES